jgi:hypothetical protein
MRRGLMPLSWSVLAPCTLTDVNAIGAERVHREPRAATGDASRRPTYRSPRYGDTQSEPAVTAT